MPVLMPYRYPRFKREILFKDAAFRGGPSPGQPMPDFDVPAIDGGRVRKSDYTGDRPLLLTFASITCPMALSAVPGLKRLYSEFSDRIDFVTLYVREAHPGERFPQPATMEQKLRHARVYKDMTQIPWPVAVDSVEGRLHKALDPRPNPTYVMDANGCVAFRALNSNDARVLRHGIKDAVFRRPPRLYENQSRAVPLVRALGVMYETLELAGEEAKRDFHRELGPAYLMVRLASLLPALPPFGRGSVVLVTCVLGSVVVFGRLIWLLRRSANGAG